MFSAIERLERILPGCQVVVAKMYTPDDGSLWGGRENAPSLHLYLCQSPGRLTGYARTLLERLHAERLASALVLTLAIARAVWLLFAVWCRRTLGMLPLLNRNAREAIRAICSCDLVYCSGGGNLNDIWLRAELLPRAVTYRVVALLEKPLIVSGQGIGPIHSRLGRFLLRWGARNARIFGCRDKHESRDLLLQLGLDEAVIQSLGDDATDLRCSDPNRVAEILASEGIPDDGRPMLAVHVRLHDFRTDFRTSAIPLLAELFDGVIERTSYRILFIPVTYSRTKAFEGDIGDAFEVYARMRRRSDVSFICREKYSPPDMKGIVGACRMLIGFSYHAWVFAMTSGIPAFGLFFGEYFRQKAEGFFGWYDRSHWAWDIETANAPSILRTIEEVAANYDIHCQDLARVTHRMIEQVEIPARLAKECLAERGASR
jgi:polysaccharide pyruvyl transferase WcaK-like protein